MPNITDADLILKLLQSTADKRIAWEKADAPDRFAARYAGKWTLTVDKSENPNDPRDDYWLALSNAEGEEIMKIYNEDRLDELFELARRQALRLDEALTDLFKEIGEVNDEDIPF